MARQPDLLRSVPGSSTDSDDPTDHRLEQARREAASLYALAWRRLLEGRTDAAVACMAAAREHGSSVGDRTFDALSAAYDALDELDPPGPRAPTTLEIGPGSEWIVVSGRRRVDLVHRPALRRVLARLVEARRGEPGVHVPWPLLLEAGWPGQRPVGASGVQRVRTAIWTLRKLGLAACLLTRDDGYLLDPLVGVDTEAEPGSPHGER